MTRIPSGLTSSVAAGGKNFILQTEFIIASDVVDKSILSGRIKTTVAVEGQVVHKVEKAFAGTGGDEESFLSAEKAVKRQHLQVAKAAAAKPKEFMASVSELNVSAADRLTLIPGIQAVTKINLTNLPEHGAEWQTDDNPVLANMVLVRDLVVSLTQNTKLGKLQKLVAAVDENKYVLTGFDGGTYFLSLKDDADVSSVFEELKRAKN